MSKAQKVAICELPEHSRKLTESAATGESQRYCANKRKDEILDEINHDAEGAD